MAYVMDIDSHFDKCVHDDQRVTRLCFLKKTLPNADKSFCMASSEVGQRMRGWQKTKKATKEFLIFHAQ